MSEENTNDVIPAVLAKDEAVISAKKVEEVAAVVEEVLEETEEPEVPKIQKAPAKEKPVEADTKVEEVAAELNLKPQISVVEEIEQKNVISSGSQNRSKPSDLAAGLTSVSNGVIGTGSVKRKSAEKPAVKAESEKVALHSTKNVSWVGVGKILKGYNIVTKDQAEKWLTRDHTRLVSPEEVAKGFNN